MRRVCACLVSPLIASNIYCVYLQLYVLRTSLLSFLQRLVILLEYNVHQEEYSYVEQNTGNVFLGQNVDARIVANKSHVTLCQMFSGVVLGTNSFKQILRT